MTIAIVARYYKQSPVDVEKWSFRRFSKYQETMMINQEIERQSFSDKPKQTGDMKVMTTKFKNSARE